MIEKENHSTDPDQEIKLEFTESSLADEQNTIVKHFIEQCDFHYKLIHDIQDNFQQSASCVPDSLGWRIYDGQIVSLLYRKQIL